MYFIYKYTQTCNLFKKKVNIFVTINNSSSCTYITICIGISHQTEVKESEANGLTDMLYQTDTMTPLMSQY